jgi:hypothetical protein
MDQHGATARRIQTAKQIQQRRFTGARAADNRNPLAAPNLQIDALQHLQFLRTFVVAFTEIAAFEHYGLVIAAGDCIGY